MKKLFIISVSIGISATCVGMHERTPIDELDHITREEFKAGVKGCAQLGQTIEGWEDNALVNHCIAFDKLLQENKNHEVFSGTITRAINALSLDLQHDEKVLDAATKLQHAHINPKPQAKGIVRAWGRYNTIANQYLKMQLKRKGISVPAQLEDFLRVNATLNPELFPYLAAIFFVSYKIRSKQRTESDIQPPKLINIFQLTTDHK